MVLHAYIKNKKVEKLKEITEEEWVQDINNYDAIIDITDIYPTPMVGWIFNNVSFTSDVPLTEFEQLKLQQESQQKFGIKLALDVVNKIGTKNLIMWSQGQSLNVPQLLTNLASIKTLLETGALKTARAILISIISNFPDYSDIFQFCIDEITNFLQDLDWDD